LAQRDPPQHQADDKPAQDASVVRRWLFMGWSEEDPLIVRFLTALFWISVLVFVLDKWVF
jgi:hypothetical protein